ncbi:MAG: hypothetical protein RMJ88_17045, partial [Thermogemmata sp.]|nr:hypothetical protein [Thermogemmata sp.]
MVTAPSPRFNSIPWQQWRKKYASQVIPPVVGIVGFLLVWQVLSVTGITRLPAPSALLTDENTRNLLLNPFFDRGGLDKGLFWQTMASLTRVVKGVVIRRRS